MRNPRTTWFVILILAIIAIFGTASSSSQSLAAEPDASKKIPVIFDTDIGDDIDDSWALVMLLNSPELDVRLMVGDNQKSEYRAKLIAKFLEVAGRTDIPVGVGAGKRDGTSRQQPWVKDYDLASYPGTVHDDGVQAIIDVIMNSDEPVTVIAVGPLLNLRRALEREPKIAEKARFVGMHGSVFKGYDGKSEPSPEYNVVADIPSCQAVFQAPWRMVITPLDTCGLVRLDEEKYAKVRASEDPLVQALVTNYRIWKKSQDKDKSDQLPDPKSSSVLFDTVAVYLAYADALCEMKSLPIRVDDKGMTVVDEMNGKKMDVATDWNDLAAFESLLLERIIERAK